MRAKTVHRRRGSLYVMVLGSAMLVTVIGLSAVMVVRVQRRGAEGGTDFAEARLYARSAIELGLLAVQEDDDWRDDYASGVWISNQAIGQGTLTLSGVDPGDDDLADSDLDPLDLIGEGVKGAARYRLQVTLVADAPPLSCLETAFHADSHVQFNSANVACDQTISTNGSVTAVTSFIASDVEAEDAITGETYLGATTAPVAARDMPDGTVFDYYVAHGTEISIYALPEFGGVYLITENVLSPARNPYGATANPEGIYVIDCMGEEIHIGNCRIVGTLVLIDPDPSSVIHYAINWEPAVANFPALLVSGSILLEIDVAVLDEFNLWTNFNPAGTPYKGDEDGDLWDDYPSKINGIIYVSGDLDITDPAVTVALAGTTIVGNTFTCDGRLALTYDSANYDNPPPGFTQPPQMVVLPGSWKQLVD